MSNKETTRPQDIKDVKFYKKASFPWAIIITLVITVAAFIGGWHAHQAQTADINHQAASLAETFAKKESK